MYLTMGLKSLKSVICKNLWSITPHLPVGKMMIMFITKNCFVNIMGKEERKGRGKESPPFLSNIYKTILGDERNHQAIYE